MKIQLEIIHRSRVNVVRTDDDGTKTIMGEAYRAGDREDWFVGAMRIPAPGVPPANFLIGRVHTNHVGEVQSRRMILAMLNSYFGLDNDDDDT